MAGCCKGIWSGHFALSQGRQTWRENRLLGTLMRQMIRERERQEDLEFKKENARALSLFLRLVQLS